MSCVTQSVGLLLSCVCCEDGNVFVLFGYVGCVSRCRDVGGFLQRCVCVCVCVCVVFACGLCRLEVVVLVFVRLD